MTTVPTKIIHRRQLAHWLAYTGHDQLTKGPVSQRTKTNAVINPVENPVRFVLYNGGYTTKYRCRSYCPRILEVKNALSIVTCYELRSTMLHTLQHILVLGCPKRTYHDVATVALFYDLYTIRTTLVSFATYKHGTNLHIFTTGHPNCRIKKSAPVLIIRQ